jgi:hypothetical protein
MRRDMKVSPAVKERIQELKERLGMSNESDVVQFLLDLHDPKKERLLKLAMDLIREVELQNNKIVS